MEITKEFQQKVSDLLSFIPDENIEFEIRFYRKNIEYVDYYKFEKILNSLIFDVENGGFGLKDYKIATTLDIIINDELLRLTIEGSDNIKMYWLTEKLNAFSVIEKIKIDTYDYNNYSVRFAVSSEKPADKKAIDKVIKIIGDMNLKKHYRLKNRYLIKSKDGCWRFDLSEVKSATATSIKNSRVMKQPPKYEIEIEYIGPHNKDAIKDAYNGLVYNTNILLQLLNDDFDIMDNSTIEKVLSSYSAMIGSYSPNNRNNGSDKLFIAANPITLHRKDIKLLNEKNYCVAPKADGVRMLLYIAKSNDDKINGRVYLLDNAAQLRSINYKLVKWAGSLVEGEYRKEDDVFLCYDMLFERGNDIRDIGLIKSGSQTSEMKGINSYGRLDYLRNLIKEINATLIENNKGDSKSDNTTAIRLKQYYFGDPYMKTKELWDSRSYIDYPIDGVIYTPINEAYPKDTSVWKSLFKWKPSELNSIDFLIKIEKDANGRDIKTPYVKYENGVSTIYQYKTLILYVGGFRNVKEGNKNVKKYMPVEFNPEYGANVNSPNYNRAFVIVDDNDRMIIKDGTIYSEIIDDTIVEFVYDNTVPLFKWKPIRVRNDKTYKYKCGESMFGNSENVANDVWLSIVEPVSYDIITTGHIEYNNTQTTSAPTEDTDKLEEYHKDIRAKVIGEIGELSDKQLISFGYYPEFTDYNIIIIDKNKRNIEKITGDKAIGIWGDVGKLIFPSQDAAMDGVSKNLFKSKIMSKYLFGYVFAFNEFNRYFENEIMLRSYLFNISDMLKIGGYVMGCCLDGRKIHELLGKREEIGDDWKIIKKYKGVVFGSIKSMFGKKIEVVFGGRWEENLVDFDFVEKIMSEYGFERVYIKGYVDYGVNNGLMNLYNVFQYKKVKHPSDALLKKLK